MEVNPDGQPKSYAQNGDAENDAAVADTLSLKEVTAFTDLCDQDESQSGDSGTENSQTESKASEKSPCKMQQGAIFSGKVLSFCCSECKGDTTYSPNDLLKHCQRAHKGTLPTYPCDLCSFVTNEFSSLQRHRIGHRDTLVTCEICNDGVQYSLLLLTRHFIMCHSCNGLFRCKKCDFSTRDVGTFVQHIHHHKEGSHKCVKYPTISPTKGKVPSGTFPFTCQLCGYGAARKEYLSKHVALAHGGENDRTYKWKAMEENSRLNSPGLKLLLKKNSPAGGSREPQWMSKLNTLPGVGLLDHNGRLFSPEKTLEETQQFLERAVGVKKEGIKWSKPLKTEPPSTYPATSINPQPKTQEDDLNIGPGILDPCNSNGLTVLMVKNKISIPPNCTTKVMGFKMVDGKKHLVLKVIPAKQEPDTKNEMSHTDDVINDEKSSSCASVSERSESVLGQESKPNTALQDTENNSGDQSRLLDKQESNMDRTKTLITQDVDKSFDDSSTLVTSLSPSTNKEATFSNNQSCTSGLENNSTSSDHELYAAHSAADEHQSTYSTNAAAELTEANGSKVKVTSSESLTSHTREVDSGVEEMSSSSESTANGRKLPEDVSELSPASLRDGPLSTQAHSCIAAETMSVAVESTEGDGARDSTTEQSRSNLSVKSPVLLPENSPFVVEESGPSLCKGSVTLLSNVLDDKNSKTNSVSDLSLPTDSSPRQELSKYVEIVESENPSTTTNEGTISDTSLQGKTSTCDNSDASDDVTASEAVLQKSPNQEVFSFHNYSKETFGSFPDLLDADEHSPEDFEEDDCEEEFDEHKLSSDWSLTLPASPPVMSEQPEECIGSEGERSACSNDFVSASGKKSLERVSDSDIEVEECIATVDELTVQALPESEKEACLLDSGKNVEDASLVEKGAATFSSAAVLGRILEEHSDAIISQQLEKERMVSSVTTQDSTRPTKTTLRILQTPEGKQQMFLVPQTTKSPYAVPVQLKSGPGFKLITKTCASQVNVSYVKPGIDRPGKGTGLSLTLNGGRLGVSAQGLSGEGKGQASLLHTVSNSGGRYIVSSSGLKGPLLVSGAVKSPSGEQTANKQPTCYIVQRPFSVAPVSTETTDSASKTVLTSHPVLAMPVNSDKTTPLQPGRQAYLVRYISPAKSGILVNKSSENVTNLNSQTNEGSKSKVLLKIVRNSNGARFLATTPYTPTQSPLYVARSSLQSPYILLSSDNSLTKLSAGLKTSNTPNGPSYKLISAKLKDILPKADFNKSQVDDSLLMQKSPFTPMDTCLRSHQKRRRGSLVEDSFETPSKSRRISSKSSTEKEASLPWEPAAKHVERTLRLIPFSPFQLIKCPCQNQPVVVLNHPDADIPEVTNIMKSVNRHKSDVIKVTLSQNTVKSLSEWSLSSPSGALTKQIARRVREGSRLSGNKVRERFILKLKLKKKSRSKYEVVRSSSTIGPDQEPVFTCWFCGRVFNNQEEWIGHGQRHLMESTRNWNKLF